MEDRLLTPEEMAERLGLAPLTVRRWMKSSELTAGKLGGASGA